jgi:hypothetical protein
VALTFPASIKLDCSLSGSQTAPDTGTVKAQRARQSGVRRQRCLCLSQRKGRGIFDSSNLRIFCSRSVDSCAALGFLLSSRPSCFPLSLNRSPSSSICKSFPSPRFPLTPFLFVFSAVRQLRVWNIQPRRACLPLGLLSGILLYIRVWTAVRDRLCLKGVSR